jgi:hypothetical protein
LKLGGGNRRQSGADCFGRTLQEIEQGFNRKIDSDPEHLGEFIIRFSVSDHSLIASLREARACVASQTANNPSLATIDDHIGNSLRQVRSARNGEQMVLSLGLRDLDKRAGSQTV